MTKLEISEIVDTGFFDEITPQSKQLSRWVYRFFLLDFVDDPKTGRDAWKSLKNGGDKCRILEYLTDKIADGVDDPDAIRRWSKNVLAPLMIEENRAHYKMVLYYCDVDPDTKRSTKQLNRIADMLIDEIWYYQIVGERPDEIFNAPDTLNKMVVDLIHERRAKMTTEQKKIELGAILQLWAFIEKEALKGLGYRRYYQSPDTDITKVTQRNAQASPDGGVTFPIRNGSFALDYPLDSGAFLIGSNLDKVYTFLCAELARQLPLCGTMDKNKRIVLSDADKNKIRANRTITFPIEKYRSECGQDIDDVRKILRGAYFTLVCGKIDTPEGLWNIGDVLEWDDGAVMTDEIRDAMPKKLRDYINATGRIVKDPIQGGVFTFTFNQGFAEYIATKYLPMIHVDAFKLNAHKNPNALALYKHIAEHYYIEVKKSHSKTSHVLSVSNLLGACSLPTEQEVRTKRNYRYDDYIRRPFERDMDELAVRLIKWYYCKPGTRERVSQADADAMPYKEWKGLNVWFELTNYDDEGLKADATRRKAAQKAKQAAKERRAKKAIQAAKQKAAEG